MNTQSGQGGVSIPVSPSAGLTARPDTPNQRSSSALGRSVVADALRPLDPSAAAATETAGDWREGYLTPMRQLVEVGLPSYDGAVTVARAGLDSLHERMTFRREGRERPLADELALDGEQPFQSVTTVGEGAAEQAFSLPYRGERLRGAALERQLDRWVTTGTMESSAAVAVREVMDHPEWLKAQGRRVVVIGAAAQMGPLQSLLHWGADVVALDLPGDPTWKRIREVGKRGAGRLTYPVRRAVGKGPTAPGTDLLLEVPEVTRWLAQLHGELVLGSYVYADGVTNLRVSMAVDALTEQLLALRNDVELAFLATPTDVFAVPMGAVDQAGRAAGHGRLSAVRRPLQLVSGNRLLARNYPRTVALEGVPVGLHDSLVPQQGPNYALAKRLQRWRATVARDAGVNVSLNVAPPTRTRSVLKNRLLATAYAGARAFGVEVFEPATSNVLMAALMVHDLHRPSPGRRHPAALEMSGAVHGGLWRQPYAPRSIIGLAVLVGLGGSRP